MISHSTLSEGYSETGSATCRARIWCHLLSLSLYLSVPLPVSISIALHIEISVHIYTVLLTLSMQADEAGGKMFRFDSKKNAEIKRIENSFVSHH